ncbi:MULTISPECIES: xylulokinase [Paenibacillus]|uniref:Sugar (Pentulose or hexulose) kinase n=1 Tax=Paenibacillus pabuli TaxID=1472 RepID=A0A855Y8I2_9BACL|nr:MULTISPECIES: FGGY-family carbohydrate kinase [Paenibacillus]PWW40739.1 sugar (pentulose or hexulose) kinase [Paenibacillus pabuli]PXW11863.1 sugar (pentulose or hexulose) kinase [Paenibacillus taichungensis]
MDLNMKQAIVRGETSLGIEFGSTRIKAVLIDHHFNTICSSNYEWANQLIDGYWTYDMNEMIYGLQQTYHQLKQEIETNYGVTIQKIGSIGCSAMMQGYIALDQTGELLVPFRTWRNATTGKAASELTEKFQFKIPERWSIAHLYQAILNGEEHVTNIDYITTLSGYIHRLLTGSNSIGIGDASGMFPIDEAALEYHEDMVKKFDDLIADKGYPWNLKDILPKVYAAGEHAGYLSEAGARLLDLSGNLESNIPLCPPEGDAGTGMVATNSVQKRTGNISVGTSIFAMIVLDKNLSTVYPEIDIVTTPEGNPVAMVLANNCSSDINAWVNMFREFYEAMGQKPDNNQLFSVLFNEALKADADGGGLLSYGYYSGENITGIAKGRPLFVRSPESRFNLANFMRVHLFAAFAALRLGLDILTQKEHVTIEHIWAHGGLFKTPRVAQKMCASALNIPVSVMSTAGEGGAWGMAILASYMVNKQQHEGLVEYLTTKVFIDAEGQEVSPNSADVNGFALFMERYTEGLAIEQSAVDHFVENWKKA